MNQVEAHFSGESIEITLEVSAPDGDFDRLEFAFMFGDELMLFLDEKQVKELKALLY